MLDLNAVDLGMLATALSDQGDYGRWSFDPVTGEAGYWGEDEDAEDEDAEETTAGKIVIEALPSWVWYRDMVDFADLVSDEKAGRRLARALDGKGAFRRFGNELHDEYPELVGVWNAFRDNRAARRAAEWLLDHELVGQQEYDAFVAGHPDPAVP